MLFVMCFPWNTSGYVQWFETSEEFEDFVTNDLQEVIEKAYEEVDHTSELLFYLDGDPAQLVTKLSFKLK